MRFFLCGAEEEAALNNSIYFIIIFEGILFYTGLSEGNLIYEL
jgi:hypothetical protein